MAGEPQSETPENRQENRHYVPKLTPTMEAAKWKPGQTGNAGGRPKRKPLTDAYAAVLGKTIPGDMARKLGLDEKATYAEVIAMALAREALKGKVQAAAELADRVEGKVTQTVSGPDEGPIKVRTLSDFYSEIPSKMTDEQLLRIAAGEE